MRRTFTTLFSLIAFLASIGSARAMVLKDVDAQDGVPRTGALIVSISSYIGDWESAEFGQSVVVNDAYGKRLAENFGKKPGVHYVEVLTGTEATASGIKAALARIAEKKLALLVFSYQGFGLGADARNPCFAAADWDHTQPFTSCLSAKAVNALLVAAAPRQIVLLDASMAQESVTNAIKADLFGPTADNWPISGDTAIVSSGKTERYVACSVFGQMVNAIVASSAPERALTYGDFTAQLDMLAKALPDQLPQGVQSCGSSPLRPSADAAWFADVVIIPAVAVQAPEVVVAPLPVVPPTPPSRKTKIGTPTVASLIATGACAAISVGSWAYGEHRLAQYNDPTWAAKYYPNDDAGRITAGEAEVKTYGALALGGGICAVGAAAASGFTWYFGVK